MPVGRATRNPVQEFLAVALAEMRAARRMARTWVFVALTMLLGVLTYVQYAGLHAMSGFASTLGSFGPKVLVTSIGMIMAVVLVIGMVFLAFDVRSRDQRERMAEVLDARPIGTVSLLAGRLTALVFVLWLTIAVVMGLIQLIGAMAKAFDWWGGDTLEPVSMMSFLLLDAIPVLSLWGSLVIFLAVAIRNRLIVALLGLGLFGLTFWATWETPFYLAPALVNFQAYLATGSEVLPEFANGVLILQRLATMLLAAALIVFAAALHPRSHGKGRVRHFGVAAIFAAFAGAFVAAILMDAASARAQRTAWIEAQVAAQAEPRADLEYVRGNIAIDPGTRIDLDLVYGLHAAEPLEELVFSFNPGLEVTQLLLDGTPAASTHDAGLLRVSLPRSMRTGERVELTVTAAGFPDPEFGYLDSEIDMDLVQGEQGNVVLLGTEASVFDPRYVALMPTVRWMPIPGPSTGNDDPSRYRRDFFTVELTVEVPTDWLVAGPGRRQETEPGRFRFAPTAPVPEVALLASRFERRALTVDELAFELLLYPGHGANLSQYADSVDSLRERIEEVLADAKKAGLTYPYGGLSLVEVPARLRVFGGGWRMDTVQALPGIMLLREYGLPTARVDTALRILRQVGELPDGEDAGREAGRMKVALLERFFANDFSGGKLEDAVARNLFKFQTGARGEGAIALDYVCHELTARLLYNRGLGDYFSPRVFGTVSGMNETMAQLMGGFFGGGGVSLTISAAETPTRASVWSRALGAPLVTLDPSEDGVGALDVLALKAPAVAELIVDGLGRETAGRFLSELQRRYVGTNFTAGDFQAVAAENGADINSLLGDWLGEAQLPGFVASAAEVTRLADDERGEPQYQVRVRLHNGEPTPGLVRLTVVSESESDESVRRTSDPIRVDGEDSVEVGLVVDTPPGEVWIAPYLALNRNDFRVELHDGDPKETGEAEPFNGSLPSEWRPPPEPGIVVDDLDPGFSIVYATPDDEARYAPSSSWWMGDVDIDQGLPAVNPFAPLARGWGRLEVAGTWGRYRHTAATARRGSGGASARFATRLPHAGRWRIDYHLPEASRPRGPGGFTIRVEVQTDMLRQRRGTLDLKIVADGEETPVEFDAAAASIGWNDLGEFSLPAGEVSLLVSNRTSGSRVVADAVRWRPVEER